MRPRSNIVCLLHLTQLRLEVTLQHKQLNHSAGCWRQRQRRALHRGLCKQLKVFNKSSNKNEPRGISHCSVPCQQLAHLLRHPLGVLRRYQIRQCYAALVQLVQEELLIGNRIEQIAAEDKAFIGML